MKRAETGKKTSVLVIGGPTASGKSALALGLAETLDGTVINADAMQVYRELSVLTARPTAEETKRVPHRLYGVMSARQAGTVAKWRKMAEAAIDMAAKKGRVPVVVGGTGLYIKALTEGLAPVPTIPPEVREAARQRRETLGQKDFYEDLAKLDPAMAKRLKPGDTQRVSRAWEVITATGRSLALFQKIPPAKSPYRFTSLVLLPPRETLYAACDTRCVRMLEAGALEEVARLLALGLNPELPAMKALGVRELGLLLAKKADQNRALEDFQRATRNYAKRQVTWFRHQLKDAQIWNEQYSERLEKETFSFIRKNLDGFAITG